METPSASKSEVAAQGIDTEAETHSAAAVFDTAADFFSQVEDCRITSTQFFSVPFSGSEDEEMRAIAEHVQSNLIDGDNHMSRPRTRSQTLRESETTETASLDLESQAGQDILSNVMTRIHGSELFVHSPTKRMRREVSPPQPTISSPKRTRSSSSTSYTVPTQEHLAMPAVPAGESKDMMEPNPEGLPYTVVVTQSGPNVLKLSFALKVPVLLISYSICTL